MKRLGLILFLITPLFAQELLEYSIKLPKSTQSKMPALFLMHGYGGNEKEFNQLIETYNDRFLIVSMRAPFSFMVFKNRWYEYSISDGDTLSNQAQITESTKRIIQTIEHIKNKHAIDEKSIFIGGFSQGAIMSYKLALSYPQKFWMLLLIGVSGVRVSIRLINEWLSAWVRRSGKRLLIVGAGDAGEIALREINKNPNFGYLPLGFVDDDQQKVGLQIHGIPVLGTRNALSTVCDTLQIEEILVAIPSMPRSELAEILCRCRETGRKVQVMPRTFDLASLETGLGVRF